MELLNPGVDSATEITFYLDPAEDLRICADLTDDNAENERRVEVWGTALRAALAEIGNEHHVRIWESRHPGAAAPGYDSEGEQTRAGLIYQSAQDRGRSFIPAGEGW